MIGRGERESSVRHECWFKQSCQRVSCWEILPIAALWCGNSIWKQGMTCSYHSTTGRLKLMMETENIVFLCVWEEKLVLRTKFYSSNAIATLTLGYVTLSSSACVCFIITAQTTASLEGETQTLFDFTHWNKTDSKANESCVWAHAAYIWDTWGLNFKIFRLRLCFTD